MLDNAKQLFPKTLLENGYKFTNKSNYSNSLLVYLLIKYIIQVETCSHLERLKPHYIITINNKRSSFWNAAACKKRFGFYK